MHHFIIYPPPLYHSSPMNSWILQEYIDLFIWKEEEKHLEFFFIIFLYTDFKFHTFHIFIFLNIKSTIIQVLVHE